VKLIRFRDDRGALQIGEPASNGLARLLRGPSSASWSRPEPSAGPAIARPDPAGQHHRHRPELSSARAESGLTPPDHPLVFAKLTSSLNAPGEPIVLPADARMKWITKASWPWSSAGRPEKSPRRGARIRPRLHLRNDVSARDCQVRRDKQWTRAKSFDTFCPLGPCLLIDGRSIPTPCASGRGSTARPCRTRTPRT